MLRSASTLGSAEPLVDLLYDFLSPLNACSNQLVTPWASLWSAEQVICRLHVQACENRCHNPDDPFATFIHCRIVAGSPSLRL